jgi:DNA repair exonuclease SbcCD ATPase subunit/DNA repair exonuclease SbcCD nuclease subunit
MIKIAQISDTHIRNLKYHEEYREVFNKIFETLKQEKPDYIVHTGDIAHTKNQISPEFVEMCSWFLKELADISPTYIILGNHDTNLKNDTRQDSISPIVAALNHQNLTLWKYSGERIISDKLAFNVLSLIDEDKWVKPSDPERINIALYHGAIAGVSTDIGYTLEHSDHELSIFEGHDYAFLGDIHKTNQVVDTEGRVRYPGSTIQQNHGETDDKGFLIWEIEDKNKFDVRHIVIPHPRPFITIKLDENGKFDESIAIKPDARIRVICEHNISVSDIRKSIDVIKVKYIPESVSFLNKATDRIDISDTIKKIDTDDLRNLQTQEKLLREYLKDFSPTEEVLQKVFEINKKYNAVAEENEEVSRNIRWSLKSLKWDNLFNYGTKNNIDFEKLKGVVGVFGKNFSGKSSIIDSLLWGVQNSTSKNVRKNVNIINQNQQNAKAEVQISVDDKLYIIERTAEKYLKKLAGEETLEAKTDVSFSVCDISEEEDCTKYEKGNLNGLDRNETDKNIRKLFGTLEDFLFTSMASQMGSLDFINEGSTRRKEILGKFLDLELFAKKYKLSNNDATELKTALKRLESKDYDKEIAETLIRGSEAKKQAELQSGECEEIKEEIKQITDNINNINIEIASFPKIEVIDVERTKASLKKIEDDITGWQTIIATNFKFIKEKESALENARKVIDDIKVDELNKKKQTLSDKNKQLEKVLREITDVEKDILRDQKAIKILDEVPCGDSFPTCKFLTDAFSKKADLEDKNELVKISNKKKQTIEEEIKQLKPDEIEKSISTRNVILEKIRNMENLISNKKLEAEQLNGKIILSQNLIEKLEKNIEDYYKNEETALKLKELDDKKHELTTEKNKLSKKLAECEASILKLHREYGSLEQRYKDLQESKSELLKLRDEYAAIAMFEKAMHSNGISYDIIRKKLPVINEEIAKILSNIVGFEIFFEDDGKKLDILIKHPKYDARPLELCSGAEKSLAAMAIRLALTKLTTLPVSDVFILDEPATALDEENMEGFMRIIDMLKSQFKTIILISHLPELKDVADLQITIDNVDGYAHVEA